MNQYLDYSLWESTGINDRSNEIYYCWTNPKDPLHRISISESSSYVRFVMTLDKRIYTYSHPLNDNTLNLEFIISLIPAFISNMQLISIII